MRIPKTSISLFPIGFFTRSKIREGGGFHANSVSCM